MHNLCVVTTSPPPPWPFKLCFIQDDQPFMESSSMRRSIIGLFISSKFGVVPDVVVVETLPVVTVVVLDAVVVDVLTVGVVIVVVGRGVVIGIRTGVVDEVVASEPVTRIGFLFAPAELAAAADSAEMEKMFFVSC